MVQAAVGQTDRRRRLQWPDDRWRGTQVRAGGKSELRRAVRRVTPGQGNLKESGTENIPPAVARQRSQARECEGG